MDRQASKLGRPFGALIVMSLEYPSQGKSVNYKKSPKGSNNNVKYQIEFYSTKPVLLSMFPGLCFLTQILLLLKVCRNRTNSLIKIICSRALDATQHIIEVSMEIFKVGKIPTKKSIASLENRWKNVIAFRDWCFIILCVEEQGLG